MRGIRLFMGWSHFPDLETYAAASDDNSFACPKTQVPGNVSVQIPTDDWLCGKLSRLNITLVEGYSSCRSEAGGLHKDQFFRPAKSQAKWYGLDSNQKADSTAVFSWSTDASHLNRSYSRITRRARVASTPPNLHLATSHKRHRENGRSHKGSHSDL